MKLNDTKELKEQIKTNWERPMTSFNGGLEQLHEAVSPKGIPDGKGHTK